MDRAWATDRPHKSIRKGKVWKDQVVRLMSVVLVLVLGELWSSEEQVMLSLFQCQEKMLSDAAGVRKIARQRKRLADPRSEVTQDFSRHAFMNCHIDRA